MTNDEFMFFEKKPELLPAYMSLRESLEARYPEMEIKVSKTQISFRNRYIFAMASILKGRLLVSFGLSYCKEAPGIFRSVEAAPNRWTHHVFVEDMDLEWIDEAYQFCMRK